ncbi:MAG: FAD-dependent oxidoreductase, partial [Planctomycetota bacterium]
VRPWLGYEGDPDWQIRPVEAKRKVVVIGAGPAGMECAATAAERGHDVVMYEAEPEVGGQLQTSSKGPHGDEEFMRLVEYLETRCQKAGVSVRTGTAATVDTVAADAPDAVVLAAGVKPALPDIPGIDRENVVTVREVMHGEKAAGERVVILGGKGIGIALAQFLLATGDHKIAMVVAEKKVGRDVNPSYIWRYVKKLKEGDVHIYAKAKATAITDEGVTVVGPDSEETVAPADTVILASVAARNELQAGLEEKFDEVHVIGDAANPRRAHNATMDGYKVGLQV